MVDHGTMSFKPAIPKHCIICYQIQDPHISIESIPLSPPLQLLNLLVGSKCVSISISHLHWCDRCGVDSHL
jgi:hypothetical protein